jgi:SNF2 family DNA or RNA helicase
MTEVNFGPNEQLFKRCDLLERIEVEESMYDLLARGQFGGPIDLRRVLIFEKIRGDLTNVFYSMESSRTDFYPHQFRPVLKFIEAPIGRLLIADEVGLGKTIESIYIWKELQARQDARRLLIVCPAMLREKWRNDLRKRFNMLGEIVPAPRLLQAVRDLAEGDPNDSFIYITSLEGLRAPVNFDDEENTTTRAQLARLLDQNNASDEFAFFDLVIIDEAHYLRNPATANNRLARLLRDAARHLVLLTATPVQIHSDNLYQLLRLLDPDEFYDSQLFSDMLNANTPIVKALRSLWRQPPDLAGARDAVRSASSKAYFKNDAMLRRVGEQLEDGVPDASKCVDLVRTLESRSLLGQHMTRSRKREVLERKVERAAQVLNVRFCELERTIYDRVTHRIRADAAGKRGVSLFPLIVRQRQMASCLVAALQSRFAELAGKRVA